MPGTTRTFLAVELPDAARLEIGRLRDRLGDRPPGLRWTAVEQVHLTLAFLGDVPDDALKRLGPAVDEEAAARPGFELTIAGLGAFPTASRARVLWAGLTGEALDQLRALRDGVASACRRAGCPPTDDRFHPHLTLGRAKGGRGRRPTPTVDLSGLCEAHRDWTAGPMPVDTVVTFASRLGPQGPSYSPLRSSLLGASSP